MLTEFEKTLVSGKSCCKCGGKVDLHPLPNGVEPECHTCAAAQQCALCGVMVGQPHRKTCFSHQQLENYMGEDIVFMPYVIGF